MHEVHTVGIDMIYVSTIFISRYLLHFNLPSRKQNVYLKIQIMEELKKKIEIVKTQNSHNAALLILFLKLTAHHAH